MVQPSGLVNYGTGCWLNTILVSLEACDSFLFIFNKYAKEIETEASVPLFEYQRKASSSLLRELSNFFHVRMLEKAEKILPTNVVEVLNTSTFPRDDQVDCNEAWGRMMLQLCEELILVQSPWAKMMLMELSALLHVSYIREQKCLDKSPSDVRCRKAIKTESINNFSVFVAMLEPFVDDSNAKKNSKVTFFLPEYISTYDKELHNNCCNFCGMQLLSHFEISNFPVMLKVDFSRCSSDGSLIKSPVRFPLKLSLNNIEYDFVAMQHRVDDQYSAEEGHLGHNFATTMRQEILLKFDDDVVTECRIPKNGFIQDASINSVIYQRADWRDISRDGFISQLNNPEYPLKFHKIYERLQEEIIKCKETYPITYNSLLTGTKLIDEGTCEKVFDK